jgi:hypothetical protein
MLMWGDARVVERRWAHKRLRVDMVCNNNMHRYALNLYVRTCVEPKNHPVLAGCQVMDRPLLLYWYHAYCTTRNDGVVHRLLLLLDY